MSETDFQALFSQYHAANMPSLRENAVIRLHEHIYRYAARRFQLSHDVSSDFYLYFQDKIENLFIDYDPGSGLSFLVFVTVRCRYAFRKFLSRRKMPRTMLDEYADWENEARATGVYDKSEQENEEGHKYIRQLLETLDREKQIILRLYFGFHLKFSHLRELIQSHNDYSFLSKYREFIQKHVESESARRSEMQKNREKLGKLYLQKMNGLEIANYEEQRDKLVSELLMPKNHVTQRDISDLLGFSLSSVNRRLKEALDELRQSLTVQVYGKK